MERFYCKSCKTFHFEGDCMDYRIEPDYVTQEDNTCPDCGKETEKGYQCSDCIKRYEREIEEMEKEEQEEEREIRYQHRQWRNDSGV